MDRKKFARPAFAWGLSAVYFLMLAASPVAAQSLFFDDFEGDLSQWVPRDPEFGFPPSGNDIIVADPIRGGNHVLTFNGLTYGGDILSSPIPVTPGRRYILSFEYLGSASPPSNGSGGTIGFSEGTNTFGGDFHRWLAGTIAIAGAGGIEDNLLIDDGQWHWYSIVFDPYETGTSGQEPPGPNPDPKTIQVMLQDFLADIISGCDAVAGDAFFDNIRISDFYTDDFLPPMGTKRKLGSTLPVKFRLYFDGVEVQGQDELDAILAVYGIDLACPEIMVYDVTGEVSVDLPEGSADNVGEGGELGFCFRYSDGNWIYNLRLDPDDGFQSGRDYLVEVNLGPFLLTPGNALFQTK